MSTIDLGKVKGDSAGFGTPVATVDNNIGTPSVSVTASGPDTAKVFSFNFKNLKGDTVASTANGLNPTLDNSTDAPIISFKGDGATEQQTYSGKNKLNVTATSKTQDGITFTVNADKSVTLNGTSTTRTYFKIGDIVDVEETSYILSGTPKGSSSGAPFLYASHVTEGVTDKHDFGNGVTIDNIADYGNISICVPVNVTVNNATFYPMLRPSSIEDATYEPYVGGTASPNQEYEQEIYGGGQSRNEFDKDNTNIIEGYLNSADNTITVGANNTTIYVPCEPNKAYTVSKAVGARFAVAYTKELPSVGVTMYGYSSNFTAKSMTIETGSDAKYLVAWVHNANVAESMTATEMLATIQIEKGTKTTPYKAFGAHSLEVKTCGDNFVYKIDKDKSLSDQGNVYDVECYRTVYATLPSAGEYFLNISANEDIRIVRYKLNANIINVALDTKTLFITATEPSELVLAFRNTDTTNIFTNLQVQVGKVIKANIPLSSPLYEKDYIKYRMDGSGEESHKMKAVVFDGSEAWELLEEGTINERFVTYLDKKAVTYSGFCSISTVARTLEDAWSQTNFIAYVNRGYIAFFRPILNDTIDGVTDLASWKAWLAENKPKVVYELAEEEVTPLTAEQIAEFEKLRTFDGTTHITCEAESEIQYFFDSVSGKAVASVVNKHNKEMKDVDYRFINTEIAVRNASNTAKQANNKATFDGTVLLSYDYETGAMMSISVDGVAEAISRLNSVVGQIASSVSENKAKIDALSS